MKDRPEPFIIQRTFDLKELHKKEVTLLVTDDEISETILVGAYDKKEDRLYVISEIDIVKCR